MFFEKFEDFEDEFKNFYEDICLKISNKILRLIGGN